MEMQGLTPAGREGRKEESLDRKSVCTALCCTQSLDESSLFHKQPRGMKSVAAPDTLVQLVPYSRIPEKHIDRYHIA